MECALAGAELERPKLGKSRKIDTRSEDGALKTIVFSRGYESCQTLVDEANLIIAEVRPQSGLTFKVGTVAEGQGGEVFMTQKTRKGTAAIFDPVSFVELVVVFRQALAKHRGMESPLSPRSPQAIRRAQAGVSTSLLEMSGQERFQSRLHTAPVSSPVQAAPAAAPAPAPVRQGNIWNARKCSSHVAELERVVATQQARIAALEEKAARAEELTKRIVAIRDQSVKEESVASMHRRGVVGSASPR